MSLASQDILVDISKPYPFSKAGAEEMKQNRWARAQWPLVYLIDGNGPKKKCYIGESTNALGRMVSHLSNPKKKAALKQVRLIGSDTFNKSVALDLESCLIQYMAAEKSYELLNGNYGLQAHNYYQRDAYREAFSKVWDQLNAQQIVRKRLVEIENSAVFKYSPYKSLNEDQYSSLLEILDGLTTKQHNRIFVEGSAGTGKTILATFLVKLLQSNPDENETELDSDAAQEIAYIRRFRERYPAARIGLVIAMDSLRATLKKVFSQVPGLHARMVISPSETFKGTPYDLLIVDEAHRLRQYRNIGWMGVFKQHNERLGLGDAGTELDWILANSRNQIFFYDRDQEVRPSDVDASRFESLLRGESTLNCRLRSQMRVQGGADYIAFVSELLGLRRAGAAPFRMAGYELQAFDSIADMHRELREREARYGLCRMIAGYSWRWASKKNKQAMDIEIDGLRFQWNQAKHDWINSPTAVDEIGSIHSTMGYDLNYAAVIFGPEISYNPAMRCIQIDPDQYHDKYGKQGIDDPEKLKAYILNIYRNMMYRGIRGTFVYAVDPALRDYFRQHIPAYVPAEMPKPDTLKLLTPREAVGNDRAVRFIDIRVAAGPFSEAQLAAPDQYIELPEALRDREDHFVCKVVGESMNRRIPNGAYCLFRRDGGGSRNGEIVLVQSTEIQDADFGSGYTVKEYHSRKHVAEDGWRHESITLRPLSDDPGYEDIVLTAREPVLFKVLGIFLAVL